MMKTTGRSLIEEIRILSQSVEGRQKSVKQKENTISALAIGIHYLVKGISTTKSQIDIILEPLKHLFSYDQYQKIYQNTFPIYVDGIVKNSEEVSRDFKIENESTIIGKVAGFVATLMYSLPKGREKYNSDDKGSESRTNHNNFRMKLTYFMVSLLNKNPNFGITTVPMNNENRLISKPFWMTEGFIKQKQIISFFSLECNKENEGYKNRATKDKSWNL